jgi:uncharacterized repeat protein (TIGR03803 family)
LYSFKDTPDGAFPDGWLTYDEAGNFYGATLAGGVYGLGTVFKLDRSGKETVLHSFAGGSDGAEPFSGVIRDAGGTLYGTTCLGGAIGSSNPQGWGTVFRLTPK